MFIAWAWPRRWAVPRAAPFVVAAALLPDLDSYIEPYPDFGPGSDFGHRGFTHSLFGAAVLAPVLALVPLWLSKEKGSYTRYARLVALIAAGILTHVVLDLPTEIGAKVFYPFYRK
ncbi:metal-dependent hydrolase, partial [bacterium]|nr:metal-dependent hydrolase [bacterium]